MSGLEVVGFVVGFSLAVVTFSALSRWFWRHVQPVDCPDGDHAWSRPMRRCYDCGAWCSCSEGYDCTRCEGVS